jgi:hypothetical protein
VLMKTPKKVFSKLYRRIHKTKQKQKQKAMVLQSLDFWRWSQQCLGELTSQWREPESRRVGDLCQNTPKKAYPWSVMAKAHWTMPDCRSAPQRMANVQRTWGSNNRSDTTKFGIKKKRVGCGGSCL